jgi:YegS/Rv2252/BmrU family lipid kinase
VYYFILNPSSQSKGAGNTWSIIIKELRKRNIAYKVYSTHYKGHATDIARQITRHDPHAVIVAVGGDGTIHDILCGLYNINTITFGVIPSGSGNDFARGMNISMSTEDAVRAVLAPRRYVQMDVGTIKDTNFRFGVSCGIGYDASVCHEALESPIKDFLNRIGLGQLTYSVIALKQIFMYPPCAMTIDLDDGRHLQYKKAYCAAVMNQPYEGGGLKMVPSARSSDGYLDVMVVADVSRFKIFTMLPTAFWGMHTHLKGLDFLHCRELHIHTKRKCPIHLDGESGGISNELHVALVPERLRVIIG